MHFSVATFDGKFILRGIVLVLFVALSAREGIAQPSAGYAQSELRRLTQRNSASFYSSKNQQQRNLAKSVPRTGVAGVNRRVYTGSPATSSPRVATKPFKGISRGPSVSPYLSLSRPFGSASDYHTLVRPMRERRREAERQQMQNIRSQRRLNSMAARAPFNTQGDPNAAPTGHAAVFQSLGSYLNTGGYYPPPSAPKQR